MTAADPVAPAGENLADGGWHRLHPSTPLLRGGIAFIAILGIVIANLRERLVELVFGGQGAPGDPVDEIVNRGLVPIALAVIAAALILFIAGFYLSWRMHTFRITDELVEVRSGILFRTHRKARLDRIQGINIVRPLFARLFGAARLEISGAGNDSNVQLAYLGGARADELRRDILRLAGGSKVPDGVPVAAPGASSLVQQRLAEFTAPELDPALAEPASVVTMHPGRLIGSTVLSTSTLMFVLFVVAGIIGAAVSREFFVLFGAVPFLFGLGSFLVNRIVKSLRYTIAGTPDGVRVGYGLFSTSNETLPPGRIHSISISQPLLWRPFDWWEVKVNRAGRSSAQGAAGQQNTTILPVGTRAEVFKVLELVLPGLVDEATRVIIVAGLARATPDDGFTNSPRRGAVLRWFSWRRNGFALRPDAVILRRGAIWRELVVVPAARMQSVSLHQGLLDRALRLAEVNVHTVAGPINARLGALDAQQASGFFRDVAQTAINAAAADRTHRWRSA
ncbi:MAG TPA: PH domain-containing protein [Pseudolysinimonas sp.]|nr:PH domain-containing protein [Pseudolysinimonas sp.]